MLLSRFQILSLNYITFIKRAFLTLFDVILLVLSFDFNDCMCFSLQLSVDMSEIQFGTTVIDETLKRTFTLTNRGALGTKFDFFKVTGEFLKSSGWLLAHLSRQAHKVSYSIPMLPLYVPPSVIRSQCSNISSETAWPIKAKFYVEPPWEGGTEVYINDPGHMTKMAVMSIYGKNL